ncbi:MAG: glycosyltransferase family 2 protein [Elusimicrobiota bacterium]|nr:glycosyltransferase family 2 protein [Elusimicrobiota bacterium]
MEAKVKTVYFVLPCFNEEKVLPKTSVILFEKIQSLISQNKISKESKAVFIDDGSTDNSWEIIKDISEKMKVFGGIKLTCNRGHQNALLAGLLSCKDFADAVISLDADLQHNIDAFDEMTDRFNEGFDIVYAVRDSNASDSFMKKIFSSWFYKVMNFMGAKLVYNSADYRLMSKRALNSLEKYKEVNLFLRGIVPTIGYKSCVVHYSENKRFGGESKYTLKSMISLALQGVTSFTIKPVRMIMYVGIIIVIMNIPVLIYILMAFFVHNYMPGWGSLLLSIWFLGGVELIAIGIVGEYLGKIYLETKNRPRFLIEESTLDTPHIISQKINFD